jgi:SAM-dependent methyltransferase
MKPNDYYGKLHERTKDWSAHAAEPGFAPVALLIQAAAKYLKHGKALLDIGCQGGHQTALLRKNFSEAVGVDIAPYHAMWGLHSGIQFLVHDIDAGPLPFPNGYFTSVVCTNVLEHVFDVFGLVREISRLLETGGTALIEVPNGGHWKHRLSLLFGGVPRTGASHYPFNEEDGWDGQHLHLFTNRELRWLVGYCGLRVDHVCVAGRFTALKNLMPSILNTSLIFVCSKK